MIRRTVPTFFGNINIFTKENGNANIAPGLQLTLAPKTTIAPLAVDLLPGSDSGSSNSDDRTNRNNASPNQSLRFRVDGTGVGNLITLYSDGVVIGSAIATATSTEILTNGAERLASGVRTITARQTFLGVESLNSPALMVTINEVPVAVNDVGGTTELGTATGNVLSNDTDPDTGETATLVVEVPGTITTVNGALTLAANGTYSYTANANQLMVGQTVTDTFTYKAKDVNGALSNVASLVITITGENDAPTAVGFSLPGSVNEGSAATVTITSVTDVDVLDTFTYNYVLKKNGVAVQTSGFVSPSTFNLTPDDGAAGIAWTVEVQARDAAGAVSPVNSQALTVTNVAPVLTRLNTALTGGVGTLFTNTGTYADVPADIVILSADIGTIINNGNGTWSWSHTPAAAVTNQVVTITGTDEDGGSSTVTFTLSATPADITPPTIGSVKVAGSAWAVGFRDFLDPVDGDNTDGSDAMGFQIPTDTLANQLRPLPWTNMNSIVLAFSEPVTGVNLANIQVIGVNKLDYKVAGGSQPQLIGVTYNSTTNEATLAFNGSLTADKLLIRVGAGLVQDPAGNALAAYSFRLNVLPGDVTQNGVVANNDITLIRAQLGLVPGPLYDPRRDLNGNGVIANNDVTLGRARLGNQLPPTDPV